MPGQKAEDGRARRLGAWPAPALTSPLPVLPQVLRGLQLLQILRRLSFRFKILEMRVVKTSNNLPGLFVLERVESDPEYDGLKAELYALGDYVSMATSTFMAVHSSGKSAGDRLSGFERK